MALLDFLSINGHLLSQVELVAEQFREWQPLAIECAAQPDVVDARLAVGDLDLGPPTTLLGDTRWRWWWNPQHAVGHYGAILQLRYADGRRHAERFALRILPCKIDAARYEALLLSIQQDVPALVYALGGGRSGTTLRPSAPVPTLAEEYAMLLERHVPEAVGVAKQIDRGPHSRLVTRNVDVPLAELDRIEPLMLAEISQAPLDDVSEDVLPALQAPLRAPGRQRGGPLPRSSSAQRSQTTYDLVEHRVLKHVLRVLLGRVGYLRSIARREQLRRQRNNGLVGSEASGAMDAWLIRCDNAAVQLRRALDVTWIADVAPLGVLLGPTELMRREPRYRRLYRLYRELRALPLLAFDSPHLWLPIHELPLLYEQWCALRVVKALLPLGTVIEQGLVEVPDDIGSGAERPVTLRLQRARPLLLLRLPDDARVAVWYQRRYQPTSRSSTTLGTLDPFVRIPDIAIEVTRPARAAEVLVVDAKYRVAADGAIPQDALDDAYAYRSAIGAGGRRATLGAVLLFPGSEPLMTDDRVGALPLLPGLGDELSALLQGFLTSSAEP